MRGDRSGLNQEIALHPSSIFVFFWFYQKHITGWKYIYNPNVTSLCFFSMNIYTHTHTHTHTHTKNSSWQLVLFVFFTDIFNYKNNKINTNKLITHPFKFIHCTLILYISQCLSLSNTQTIQQVSVTCQLSSNVKWVIESSFPDSYDENSLKFISTSWDS